MPTYQVVGTKFAGAFGGITITRDPALEAIAAIPDLMAWFDPDARYSPGGSASDFIWRDKARGRSMLATGTNRPAPKAINSEAALGFGNPDLPTGADTNGRLVAQDLLLPASDWTLVFGVELGSGARQRIFGSGDATNPLHIGINFSTGYLDVTPFFVTGGTTFTRITTDLRSATHVIAVGYTAATGAVTLRRNGAQAAQRSGAAAPLASTLWIGGSAGGQPLLDTRLGEVLMFGADLTVAGRSADMALVETHLMALYGIT